MERDKAVQMGLQSIVGGKVKESIYVTIHGKARCDIIADAI